MRLATLITLSALLVSAVIAANDDQSIYNIGVGIADITGPAAEVNMMGYAKFGQDTAGIHTRLYARTFIVQQANGNRIAYISCDLGMVDQVSVAHRYRVLLCCDSSAHDVLALSQQRLSFVWPSHRCKATNLLTRRLFAT